MKTPEYLRPLQAEFEKYADPEKAVPMRKYMKDKFEFFGISSPARKKIYQRHKRVYGLIPEDNKTEIVTWCWETPQREYQYFAMEFLGKTKNKIDREIIVLYEYMITHKSWWDTVDYISSNLVGPYFLKFPEKVNGLKTKWMHTHNIWLQRTCLLFQLKYRDRTDTQLLASFIGELAGHNNFFIRKAIGWALREYSKTDPDFVIRLVQESRLSGLSRREALKWLSHKGIFIPAEDLP